MNPLADVIETLGLASVWTYLALFLGTSLLMVWKLEALRAHGLEGTALGTLIMPWCSGLGNLLFVVIVFTRGESGQEVLINCLVNNATNLTLLLGLPALLWGLTLDGGKKGRPARRTGKGARAADTAQQLSRLSLLLTLTAVLFFSGVTWALGSDGRLDRRDGLVLVALFLFWQSFQVFDVLKHNARRQRSFEPLFYLDLFILLLGAYGLYVSIDWLVAWLSERPGGLIGSGRLGWLSGWLMVVPNALLAFYFAARRRADIAYASQVGDGHICIPLCLGLSVLLQPMSLPETFGPGLAIIAGAATLHLLCVTFAGGLPRWMGWPLLAGYAWFVGAGFF